MASLERVPEPERISIERISVIRHLDIADHAGSTIADMGSYLASTDQISDSFRKLSDGSFQINEGGNPAIAQGCKRISSEINSEENLAIAQESERISLERIVSGLHHLDIEDHAGSTIADMGSYLASTDQMSESLRKLSDGSFQINEGGNPAIAQGRKRISSEINSEENLAIAQESERKRFQRNSEEPIIAQEPGRKKRRRRKRGKRGGNLTKARERYRRYKMRVSRWMVAGRGRSPSAT